MSIKSHLKDHKWKYIIAIGIIIVFFITLSFVSFHKKESPEESVKNTPVVPTGNSRNEVYSDGYMFYPSIYKVNSMKVPKVKTPEPNVRLIQANEYIFQTTKPIRIGFTDEGKYKEITWKQNMSGGFDYFPVGTTEYFVFNPSEDEAVFTVINRSSGM